MDKIVFGRTGLTVSRTGFGMLPLQRISMDDAAALLRRAYEAGVTFYDTARGYSDSEAKFAYALSDVRENVVLATKTLARTGDAFARDLETSLKTLHTDYIDLYQLHNTPFLPLPGGEDGLYDAALKAKRAGLIRHIGITQHLLARAVEAVRSGLYDTIQYPLSHLATEDELALVRLCEDEGVGFIAMKAMSGGLVTDARLPFAFLRQYAGVVPIWGIQHMHELDEFLAMSQCPPVLDDALWGEIERDRAALSGAFCRSCGYCMPCPVGIDIRDTNRMTQLLNRAVSANWMTDAWRQKMELIEQCTRCGACERKCPYSLKPYETMPVHLAYYREYYKRHHAQ